MYDTHVVSVAHTGITVSDLDRAIRFFRDGLGAVVSEPVLYTDSIFERVTGVPGANIRTAYADLPGHQIELLEYLKPEDRITSSLRPCDPGHMHLSLTVRNIEDLIGRMSSLGFQPVGPIQSAAVGAPIKFIYTYGFDGLVIELMDFT